MGYWIEEIGKATRQVFKNYIVFWGIIGVFLGVAFNSFMVFVPLCFCVGYYAEDLYKMKMEKTKELEKTKKEKEEKKVVGEKKKQKRKKKNK